MDQVNFFNNLKERLEVETEKVKAEYDAKLRIARDTCKELSDEGVLQLLETDKRFKDFLATDLEEKLATEVEAIKAEYDEKLRRAADIAETSKANAVLLEAKKSAVRLSMMENKIKVVNAKLQVVEAAKQQTPEVIRRTEQAGGAGHVSTKQLRKHSSHYSQANYSHTPPQNLIMGPGRWESNSRNNNNEGSQEFKRQSLPTPGDRIIVSRLGTKRPGEKRRRNSAEVEDQDHHVKKARSE